MKSRLPNRSLPNDPSRKKLGAFLIASQLHSSNHTSALFLTAAAQNLLCLNLAASLGIVVQNAWVTWFIAASVPAIAGIALTPYLCYKMLDPELKDTPEAPAKVGRGDWEIGGFLCSLNNVDTTYCAPFLRFLVP